MKNFIIILLKFVFSNIINWYWMAISAVTDLGDHLFFFKKKIER